MDTNRWHRRHSRGAVHCMIVGLALLVPLGCGEEGVTPTTVKKAMPLDQVPEVVMKAANKELPGITINNAWQNLDKGVTLQSYELRGQRKDGKISEVRISPSGAILEREG